MDFRLFEFPAFTLLFLGQKNLRHFRANKDETQPTKRDETKRQKWGHLAFFWCSLWRNTLWVLTSAWIPGSFVVRRSVVMLVIWPRWRITAPRFGVGWHAATGPGEKCCWCLVQQRERVVKLWLIQMKWEWWWATSTWILSHDSTIRKKNLSKREDQTSFATHRPIFESFDKNWTPFQRLSKPFFFLEVFVEISLHHIVHGFYTFR